MRAYRANDNTSFPVKIKNKETHSILNQIVEFGNSKLPEDN